MAEERGKPGIEAADHELLVAHLGRRYADPQMVSMDGVEFGSDDNLDTLIGRLVAFRDAARAAGATVRADRYVDEGDCFGDSFLRGYEASRVETPDEVARRIASALVGIRLLEEKRRQNKARRAEREREKYLELKKIYEPDR